jgi:hypothetical protein
MRPHRVISKGTIVPAAAMDETALGRVCTERTFRSRSRLNNACNTRRISRTPPVGDVRKGGEDMRIPITPSAIEVLGKANLAPARHRPTAGESRRARSREAPPRPIQAFLVAARLRTARA